MNDMMSCCHQVVKYKPMSEHHRWPGDDGDVSRRADDVALPVYPEWVADLEAWLTKHKVSKRALAKRIGMSQSTLSRLCSLEYETSADIPAICRATGLRLPVQEVPADVQAYVAKVVKLAALSPELAKAQEAQLDALLGALEAKLPPRK